MAIWDSLRSSRIWFPTGYISLSLIWDALPRAFPFGNKYFTTDIIFAAMSCSEAKTGDEHSESRLLDPVVFFRREKPIRPLCLYGSLPPKVFVSHESLYRELCMLVGVLNNYLRECKGVMSDGAMFVLIMMADVISHMYSPFAPTASTYPASGTLKLAIRQFVHRFWHLGRGIGPISGGYRFWGGGGGTDGGCGWGWGRLLARYEKRGGGGGGVLSVYGPIRGARGGGGGGAVGFWPKTKSGGGGGGGCCRFLARYEGRGEGGV